MKKIAVMGTGYVGLVSGTCFAEIGNEVICCDVNHDKIRLLQEGRVPIYEPGLEEMIKRNTELSRLSFSTDLVNAIQSAEIIYIAVGTPMSESGAADMKYVSEVARTIGQNLNEYKVVVTKSTVPVGTGKLLEQIIKENRRGTVDFDVVSNPEFLREGTALHDCMNMDRAVIGATSAKAANIVEDLHKPFNTQILKTDLESAEMIKYASNAFLATKISFINGIANICERVGADVADVAKGMGMDHRIGQAFLKAGIGYGGSCFPKDTHALVHISEESGYSFDLLKSVIDTNDRQKRVVVDKVKTVLGSLQGKKIAVLGLAFKPNTDDMREAPSLHVIPRLLQEGAEIHAFDPIALEQARLQIGDRVTYHNDLLNTVEHCDAALILTEWNEIIEMDLNQVRSKMNAPILIDGRNCFSLEQMNQAGFIYHSIGRTAVERVAVTHLN